MMQTDTIDDQHAALTARLRELAAAGSVATPQYRKLSVTHAMVTELRDGAGSPEQRAEVARRLAEMEGP